MGTLSDPGGAVGASLEESVGRGDPDIGGTESAPAIRGQHGLAARPGSPLSISTGPRHGVPSRQFGRGAAPTGRTGRPSRLRPKTLAPPSDAALLAEHNRRDNTG